MTLTDRSHAPRGNAASDALRPAEDVHQATRPTRSVTGFVPKRSVGTINHSAVCPMTPFRLKPVPSMHTVSCRAGFSREAFDLALDLPLLFQHKKSRHRQTRLGCRPNADDAQWAERHGCRESAVRTWMSVRREPTERRRSEGTRRSRAQPRAGTLGYLGCFSK
jgi:hypothetical protein